MWIALASLPGKLNELLSRLTADRAVKLDSLDVVVSTRAPSSTALSTATWTGSHANKVNALVVGIASSVPIAAGWHVNDNHTGDGSSAATSADALRLAVNGQRIDVTSSTFVDAIVVTGSGVINFIAVGAIQALAVPRYRLYIDGVLIADTDTTPTQEAKFHPVIGGVAFISQVVSGVSFDQIPFKESFSLQLRDVSAARTNAAIVRYRRIE